MFLNLFRNQILRADVDANVNGNNDPYIPLAFVDLLRVGLSKMIGCGWLHPSLGGLEFWNKFPVKYQTVRSYERQKVINNYFSFYIYFTYIIYYALYFKYHNYE